MTILIKTLISGLAGLAITFLTGLFKTPRIQLSESKIAYLCNWESSWGMPFGFNRVGNCGKDFSQFSFISDILFWGIISFLLLPLIKKIKE